MGVIDIGTESYAHWEWSPTSIEWPDLFILKVDTVGSVLKATLKIGKPS